MGINSLRERINFLLKEKNYSVYKLGKDDNSRAKLSNQIYKATTISANTIELILTTFPDVSAEWLLRGEGTMDKAGHFALHMYASNGSIVQVGQNKGDAEISSPSQYELYGKDMVIAAKDAEITALNTLITELRQDKQNLNLLLQALTNNYYKK